MGHFRVGLLAYEPQFCEVTSTFFLTRLITFSFRKIALHIKSFCMFATHFHELTTLEDEVASVKNVHVTAIVGMNGPTFLYRVKPGRITVTCLYRIKTDDSCCSNDNFCRCRGVCDRSYGIHIAELVQFPEEVLQVNNLVSICEETTID